MGVGECREPRHGSAPPRSRTNGHGDGGENVGRVLQVRTPVGQPANPTAPPRLGEHSREVLGEYGFSDAEITGIVGV